MLTICFCFRVRRILLKSKNLGNTGRGPNTLSQVRAGGIVRMHPVLGTQAVPTFWAFHLLGERAERAHHTSRQRENLHRMGEIFLTPKYIFGLLPCFLPTEFIPGTLCLRTLNLKCFNFLLCQQLQCYFWKAILKPEVVPRSSQKWSAPQKGHPADNTIHIYLCIVFPFFNDCKPTRVTLR